MKPGETIWPEASSSRSPSRPSPIPRDHPVGHRDVGGPAGRTRAVHHGPAPDHQVCGHDIPPQRLPVTLLRCAHAPHPDARNATAGSIRCSNPVPTGGSAPPGRSPVRGAAARRRRVGADRGRRRRAHRRRRRDARRGSRRRVRGAGWSALVGRDTRVRAARRPPGDDRLAPGGPARSRAGSSRRRTSPTRSAAKARRSAGCARTWTPDR